MRNSFIAQKIFNKGFTMTKGWVGDVPCILFAVLVDFHFFTFEFIKLFSYCSLQENDRVCSKTFCDHLVLSILFIKDTQLGWLFTKRGLLCHCSHSCMGAEPIQSTEINNSLQNPHTLSSGVNLVHGLSALKGKTCTSNITVLDRNTSTPMLDCIHDVASSVSTTFVGHCSIWCVLN